MLRLFSLCLSLLAACGSFGTGPSPSPRPASGGTVRVGLPEVGPLDPARVTGPSGLTVLRTACDTITTLNPSSGRPEPALAKSWSFHPGAQRLSVQLKDGLQFHDGTGVNAQSVRESLSRVARPATASPWANLVANISGFEEVQSAAATHLSGVKALDSSKLEIHLSRPFSDLPTLLAHPALTPVSLESLETPAAGPELPVCSGPYEIRGGGENELRLVRRAESSAAGNKGTQKAGTVAPPAGAFVVKGFAGIQDAYAAFQSGDVDLAPVPEGEIGNAQNRRGFERQPGPQTAILAFDATRAPTNDPQVRQAISLAVDRLVIIDATFPDQRRPALRWLPETFGREAGPACAQFIRKVADPEKAKARLAESGADVNGPIPLIFDAGQFGRLVAQAIQVQVRTVAGIDLAPQAMDAAEFESSLAGRSPPGIWLMNASVELPIPDELIGSLFATGSARNRTGFSDPDVDAAIDRARRAATEPEAARLWVQAENMVCEKMPATPMWRTSGQWMRNPDRILVQGDSMLDVSGNPVLRALRQASGGRKAQSSASVI